MHEYEVEAQIVEDNSFFKVYKTNQKDKNHKSTNAGQVMIIVYYISHLLLEK